MGSNESTWSDLTGAMKFSEDCFGTKVTMKTITPIK